MYHTRWRSLTLMQWTNGGVSVRISNGLAPNRRLSQPSLRGCRQGDRTVSHNRV
ncbi:hypothetical protein IQ268_14180 [Oculatella sp. LEGE 06141]|uniref:hypothetical protein n=1 Tax=Oculatella sp. LEGE 06141 TaxID=1828648 RepID=UPI001880905B|nr:hypothetical protein [Oculatella sp. LEGE 06141]MBE9179713.1 hypothetical protein [Oculatella sp. LEGE 06141]